MIFRFGQRILLFAFFIVGFAFSPEGFSWGRVGHEIVAVIAYEHLNPTAKHAINNMTSEMFLSKSSENRFIKASVWPDLVKKFDVEAFNSWHYINYPYSTDGTKTQPYSPENVAWAIQQGFKVLSSPRSNLIEKAWFLNFLIHFVGDAHQPLHSISLYSATFPEGDRGGTLFPINAGNANNLHEYWDEGAGLYNYAKPFGYRHIKQTADQYEQLYPQSYFGNQAKDLDPWNWTKQSYELAIQDVYTLSPNSTPSSSYVKMAQSVVKKQLVLAGYRLANMLNVAFSHGMENDQ